MQYIHIEKIKIKNVCGYRDEMEFEFPIGKFVTIIGKNGAGKSTIFKSISMALYGDDGSVKGERLTIADMVNDKEEKNLEIILNFSIKENDTKDNYKIELYYKHTRFKNKMYLFKNGEELLPSASKSEKYAFIENLLVPRNVYHNMVYFGQQVKDFFTCLKNSEQKEIFDSILSLDEYELYRTNTISSLKIVDDEISLLQNNRDIKNNLLSELNNNYSDLCEEKSEFYTNRESKLTELNDSITNHKIELLNVEKELVKASSEHNKIEQLKHNLYNYEGNLKIAEGKLNRITEQHNNDRSSYLSNLNVTKELELSKRKSELDVKVSEAKETIRHKIEDINDQISARLQEFNDTKYNLEKEKNEHREKYNDEIKSLQEEYNKTTDEYNTNVAELNKILDRVNEITNDKQTKINKAESITNEGLSLKKKLDALNSEVEKDVDSLKIEDGKCSKCQQVLNNESKKFINESIESNKKLISELEKDLDIKRNLLKELKKEVEELNQCSVDLEKEHKHKLEEENHIFNNKKSILSDENKKIQEVLSQIDFEYNKKIENLQVEYNSNKTLIEHKSELENKNGLIDARYNDRLESIKREIDETYELEKQKKLESLKLKYDEQSNEEISHINELNQSILDTKNRIEQFSDDRYRQLQTQKTVIETKIENNTEEIERTKLSQFNDSKIKEIQTRINNLKDEISTIGSKLNELLKEKEILEFWKIGFSDSGIKSMLIDVSIPHMNKAVREFLDVVCEGKFSLSFDTISTTKKGDMRDRFSVNVVNHMKGTKGHKKLSGGEKRIIDLATMQALRSLTENIYNKIFLNTFYDEVLDSLDDDSCQLFGQVVKKIYNDKNVTLITHNSVDNIEPDEVFSF